MTEQLPTAGEAVSPALDNALSIGFYLRTVGGDLQAADLQDRPVPAMLAATLTRDSNS